MNFHDPATIFILIVASCFVLDLLAGWREVVSDYPRPVREIAREMAGLDDGDPEYSHSRGDDLLVETIERLAAYATDTTDEGDAEDVLTPWKRLRKWYA